MSSTQLGTPQRSAFHIGEPITPPTTVPATIEPPVAPKPPRVPIATRVKERVDAFQKTPMGEGIANWVNAVGSVAGYVVPVAVAAGVGYAIGGVSGSARVAESTMWLWGVAGAVASVGSQGSECLANVRLHKREGHKFPRLAAFRDVMGWFIAPASIAGLAAAYAFGPDAGTYVGAGVGATFASMGLSVYAARTRRR